MAERSAVASKLGRAIGPIPDIADVDRRERCRESLRLFCETYNPRAFYHGWSDDHLKAIQRIEEAATHGALFAFAMPRGSGKTTLCRMAALWAISYRLCRYVYVIGATADKAERTLNAIKVFIRFLPEYGADFPEIATPPRHLKGIANRASGQIWVDGDGEEHSTMIEWGKERVVLATVPPPSNWPDAWPLSPEGMVPTSGSIIYVSGLTGEGIRGSLDTLTNGEQVRPDLVLLDDPQTDESAKSPQQNHDREQLISGAVLGMAGPGETISAVMPCTVIRKGDMVDTILDRKKHPLWRGERTKMLRTMPTNLEAWEEYFEVYRACAAKEPPDFTEANELYLAKRDVLDAGAAASWEDRKLDTEVSAIQHAMNLYCRDAGAFFAEYQNEPVDESEHDDDLPTADQIMAKTLGLPRLIVPMNCTRVTGFIDVQGDLLFYTLIAWGDDFTGHVIDYGAFPDQARSYFTKSDAKTTLSKVYPRAGKEGRWYTGLEALCDMILGRDYRREDGSVVNVGRCLIDSGFGISTDTVYRFCRESRFKHILQPSKGEGITASKVPYSELPRTRYRRRGPGWYEPKGSEGKRALQNVMIDTNWWKSFVMARLAQAKGEPGSLTLFQSDKGHRLLADHYLSEYRVKTEGRGRVVHEWKAKPGNPDNDLLDCLVGCAVAASMEGSAMSDHQATAIRAKKRIKLSDLQKRKGAA